MRKNKWSNFFGTILAGGTVASVAITANHLAKKYGEKPNKTKLYEVSTGKIITYAIDKFLKTDDDELISVVEQSTENKADNKEVENTDI